MSEYQMVRVVGKAEFEAEVARLAKDGWQTTGEVETYPFEPATGATGETVYAQALAKPYFYEGNAKVVAVLDRIARANGDDGVVSTGGCTKHPTSFTLTLENDGGYNSTACCLACAAELLAALKGMAK